MYGALQNRTRTHKVASGLMMESDGQLNQTLDVEPEMPTQGPVARQRAPNVFESFMSVEEMGAVEQIDTSSK